MSLSKISVPDLTFSSKTFTVYQDSVGEIWFQGLESCNQLELTNPTVTLQRHVFPEYRCQIADGRGKPAWFIKEPGLYQLIFAASTEQAEKFRRWVFEEILPAIRRTGSYTATESDQKYFQPFGITLQQKLEECDRAIQTTDVTSNKMRNILANKKALESARRAEMRVSLESPDAESEWSISILDFAEQRESVSVGEVIEGALKVPVERRLQMQVAALLKGKGWKKRRVFSGSKGKSNQRWFNPNEPLPQAT
jgi:prophage antirepressor-like protein